MFTENIIAPETNTPSLVELSPSFVKGAFYFNNMEEIWKDITGYEGLYQVSNFGRVKSLARKVYRFTYKERLTTTKLSNTKYLCCKIYKNGIEKCVFIHRLIAQEFIPNPLHKKEVNHKDGNKLNNAISNLEWCTHSENEIHKHETLNKCNGEDSHFSKLTEQQVCEIRAKYKPRIYTFKKLGEEYNVGAPTIFLIVKNKRWKYIIQQ